MINKVILVGNLGKDPEVNYTQTGKQIASFNMATSEHWKDKQGNRKESTEWHNVVAWGALAEIAEKYLKKGSKVYLEGKLQTRSWDDKHTGKKCYITEVQAKEIKILSEKGGNKTQGFQAQEKGEDIPF